MIPGDSSRRGSVEELGEKRCAALAVGGSDGGYLHVSRPPPQGGAANAGYGAGWVHTVPTKIVILIRCINSPQLGKGVVDATQGCPQKNVFPVPSGAAVRSCGSQKGVIPSDFPPDTSFGAIRAPPEGRQLVGTFGLPTKNGIPSLIWSVRPPGWREDACFRHTLPGKHPGVWATVSLCRTKQTKQTQSNTSRRRAGECNFRLPG
eukprot:gene10276-biopygen9323